jgi:hypothetical protein
MEDLENESIDESINSFILGSLMSINTVMPGKIIKYSNGFCSVQPIFKSVFTDFEGTEIIKDKDIIENVPVLHGRGGGFIIDIPLKPDDLVMLLFSQRSIDNYLETDGKSTIDPLDSRIFDISDCFALPVGITKKNKPSAYSSGDLVIKTENGASEFHMTLSGDVNVKAGIVRLNSLTADKALALATDVKSKLDGIASNLNSHTHTAIALGSPTSNSITPLIQDNTVASTKVFTNG